MKFSISIIVPIFNTEKYLPRCIDSIINQSLKEMEIILVDDGSTDCSGEICDKYATLDSRIKVIHKNNGGLVSARQAGIQIATGKYVGFVDSDDWIESDMYRTMMQQAESNDADVVIEGILYDVDETCTKGKNRILAKTFETVGDKEYLYYNMMNCEDYFCLGVQPYLCNKIFLRELVMNHMLTIDKNIKVGEDAAAVYPMLLMANSIVVTEDCHYHYCMRISSMMLKKKQSEEEYKNAFLLDEFLKKSFNDLSAVKYLEEPLRRYTMNNLLTRTFPTFATCMDGSEMFPYAGINYGDSIILYGAGALGKAVYGYINKTKNLNIKAWVDQSAKMYQKLGMPVIELNKLSFDKKDKIVVAVFSESIFLNIEKSLMDKGISKGRIHWLSISKEIETKILEKKIQ